MEDFGGDLKPLSSTAQNTKQKGSDPQFPNLRCRRKKLTQTYNGHLRELGLNHLVEVLKDRKISQVKNDLFFLPSPYSDQSRQSLAGRWVMIGPSQPIFHQLGLHGACRFFLPVLALPPTPEDRSEKALLAFSSFTGQQQAAKQMLFFSQQQTSHVQTKTSRNESGPKTKAWPGH